MKKPHVVYLAQYLCVALMLVALSSCQTTSNKPRVSKDEARDEDAEEQVKGQAYEISATDTLESIAEKFDLDPEELAEFNNLKSPYILSPGQLIRIPIDDSERENLEDDTDGSPTQQRQIVIAPRKK